MGDTPATTCCTATTAGGVEGAGATSTAAARDAVKKEARPQAVKG
tara:strand:+ start:924 stop:1058 length:135 start_codon:yes stop_codon:yes gene_type:complete